MSDQPVYVYVIAQEDDGNMSSPTKVGITTNVKARLASVQTGSPHKLQLVHAFVAPSRAIARIIEGGFHEGCADRRLNGEWFDIDPFDALMGVCGSYLCLLSMMQATPEQTKYYLERAGVFEAVSHYGLGALYGSNERVLQ
jgi:hypothetical protein